MNTTIQTTHTINTTIPSERVGELEARVAKLNKKATKYGINPVLFVVGIEKVDEQREIMVTPISVSFEPIMIAGGWRFIASIEHDTINGEQKNLVTGYNLSKEDEQKYRHVESHCEHCNVKRHRNLTYVVKSENNETKQVGSTCLREYLGVAIESQIHSLEIVQEINELEDENNHYWSSRESFQRVATLEKVVAVTLATIDECGFVSKSQAIADMSCSTAVIVGNRIFPSWTLRRKEPFVADEKFYIKAKQIIEEWTATLVPRFENDCDSLDSFEYKVAMSAATGWVKPKNFNTVVASTFKYLKIIQERNKPKLWKDEFVPQVKINDVVVLDLTVSRMNKIDGEWGTTTILGFLDNDGRQVTWFASGSLDENQWETGKIYRVKGRVKDLKNDPRFGKQTVLTRVKKV